MGRGGEDGWLAREQRGNKVIEDAAVAWVTELRTNSFASDEPLLRARKLSSVD